MSAPSGQQAPARRMSGLQSRAPEWRLERIRERGRASRGAVAQIAPQRWWVHRTGILLCFGARSSAKIGSAIGKGWSAL